MADNEKIKELSEKIAAGVKQTFESGNYKKYLKSVSLFHNYSPRNTLLIFMQRRNATHVAGYETWKNQGRFVKRDEKGIAIIAPSTSTVKVHRPVCDDEGNEIQTPGGQAVTEQVKETRVKFSVQYVYDVSQTDGEPLPEICKELQGNVDDYEKIFTAIKKSSPYKIEFEQIKTGAKGYCQHHDERIAIKLGMSDEQIIKTVIHEFAHATLHKGAKKSRDQKEVEAESIAYIVSGFFGVDTSGYSFDYIADWSRDLQIDQLQQILENIQTSANQVIHRLQDEMKLLEKDQSRQCSQKQNLQERLTHAAEKSIELNNEKESDGLEKNLLK